VLPFVLVVERGVEAAPLPARLLLRGREERPSEAADSDANPNPEKDFEEPADLVCARCAEPVTSDAEWMEVGGARQHTFANPHGFFFRIGCFARARALQARGLWSDEWSWFPPCSWQIRVCARCDEHLGWAFRSEARSFFGLILDRLRRLGPGGPERL
jgi:hypothetical protein